MKIMKYPHPALREKAQPVTAIDKDIQTAAARMLDLMYTNEGLGLAAPQVALPVRLLVMNFEGDPEKKEAEFVAINPVIVETKGGTISDREGCLSFPGLYQNVRRAKTVKVQFYDLQGVLKEMVCSDLPARVWQHEIDHLDGVLFIDKMGMLGRLNSRKAIEEFIDDFRKAKEKGDLPKDLEPKF